MKQRNKNSKIIITFDDHNFPHVELRHVDSDQMMDAGIFLKGLADEQYRRIPIKVKKIGFFHKTIRLFKRLWNYSEPAPIDMRNIRIYEERAER